MAIAWAGKDYDLSLDSIDPANVDAIATDNIHAGRNHRMQFQA